MKFARLPAGRIGISVLSLGLLFALQGGAHAEGDVKAGREKAHKCEACHGLDGVSKVVEAPNLAGQNEQYIVEQLRAFTSGTRKNELMSVIAPTLSPQDIQDVAAYYSAIEVAIKKIPGE